MRHARELEREINELQTRHAAFSLHTQTVVDENARLRSALKELVAQCRAGGDESCPWWRAAVDNAESALALLNASDEPRRL